ncbi:hypothetical protein CDD80_6748 [Ophiocordyceps camponoti-rufipedis]|uniref:Uncharacterized protein n=1 Tax=Ophiocordyceps camponoti-rufipedis TaxID=2004952 RepID=A0A2C5XED9_9HYPO|nr:hypothetical protein CDD80_6748 [Ophiocordyceps camponoti-rufipedis]
MKSVSVLAVTIGLVSAVSVPPQLAERSFIPALTDLFRRGENQGPNQGQNQGQNQGPNQGPNQASNKENRNGNNENRNGQNDVNNGNNENRNSQNDVNGSNGSNNSQNSNGSNGSNGFRASNMGNGNTQSLAVGNNDFNDGNNIRNFDGQQLLRALEQNGNCQAFIQTGCEFNNAFNRQMFSTLANNVQVLAAGFHPQLSQFVNVQSLGNLQMPQLFVLQNQLSNTGIQANVLKAQGVQTNDINTIFFQPVMQAIATAGLDVGRIQNAGITTITVVH